MTTETKTPTREELFKPFDPAINTLGPNGEPTHWWIKTEHARGGKPYPMRLMRGMSGDPNGLELTTLGMSIGVHQCLFGPAIPGPEELAANAKVIEEAQSIIYASDKATMERDNRIAELEEENDALRRDADALRKLEKMTNGYHCNYLMGVGFTNGVIHFKCGPTYGDTDLFNGFGPTLADAIAAATKGGE